MPDLRLGILDQSPIPEGCTAGDALRNSDRPRAPRRQPRLHPLLGGRTPWDAGARVRQSGSADRSDRRGHIASARRQRRSDAAALQPAQSRRNLQHAERTLPRPYRSRHRPRRRNHSESRLRAAARPPPGCAGRFSRAARRTHRPTSAIARSFASRAPRLWLLGSSQDSAVWAAELGLPYVFADFINPNGAQLARYYRQQFTASDLARARAPCRRVGHLRRNRCRSGTALSEFSHDDDPAVPWAVDPGPDRRTGAALSGRGRACCRTRCPSAGGSSPARPPVFAKPSKLSRGDYEAEEVLIVNILHDHAARRRSYELIAKEFGMDN